MKNTIVVFSAIVAILTTANISHANTMGYVATFTTNSVIYLTDIDLGDQTPCGGPSGIGYISSLDVSPIDGSLYALDIGGNFYTVNTSTGIGTLIKDVIFSSAENSLAFAADGTLYAAGEDTLYMVNTATGDTTVIGSLYPYIWTSAFAIDSSGKAVAWDSGANWLFEIDLTDASTQSIGYLNGSFDAFDYASNGLLYAGSNGNTLYNIDVDNRTATELIDISHNGTGFAVIIPEPATFFMLGLSVFMIRRRKQQH